MRTKRGSLFGFGVRSLPSHWLLPLLRCSLLCSLYFSNRLQAPNIYLTFGTAMATTLVNRFSHSQTLGRLAVNFIRNLSAVPVAATSPNSQNTSNTTNKSKKKKKNLFEVAQFLPNWGIGYHMAKTHWKDVSYEITKINLYKDGKHGKAWGLAHKNGSPAADAPKKISGVHKRCWRYLPNLSKTSQSTSILISSKDSGLSVPTEVS